MQKLIMFLECDMFMDWNRFEETLEVVIIIFCTQPNLIKLVNAFNIVLLMEKYIQNQ